MIIPFQTTDWTTVPVTEHPGETGKAFWQTLQYSGLRVRLVEYTPGYKADHWCEKGHIIFCIEGEITSELADGASSHRSITETGAKLFIIDGDFLKEPSNR